MVRLTPLVTPQDLKAELPSTTQLEKSVISHRAAVIDVLNGKDKRWLAIVGPCSIHDSESALEYATRLTKLNADLKERMLILMRVYFEKPRTSTGWRGLIFDPHINNSYQIEEGLRRARSLLIQIGEMGISTASEVLDPIVPQYIDDLLCWASIGARTTESQTHRELASGLSMPVGFKNNTDGNIMSAINAMISSQRSRKFIGIDQEGRTCVVETRGNRHTHLILRGGTRGVNYHSEHIQDAKAQMEHAQLSPRIVIDCSHANSEKRHNRQGAIYRSVVAQRVAGQEAILGAMLESNLSPGRQDIESYSGNLKYGISITDACIGWEETEQLLRWTYQQFA